MKNVYKAVFLFIIGMFLLIFGYLQAFFPDSAGWAMAGVGFVMIVIGGYLSIKGDE